MFIEDLSVFFDDQEFGCSATMTPGGAGNVLFDESGTLVDQMGIQSVEPTALCPISQWPAVAHGHLIAIQTPAGLRNFIVRGIAPVDDGALKLLTLARV